MYFNPTSTITSGALPMFNPRVMTLVSMIACVAAARIIPQPWNFTPIGAMCLFGGAYFQRKWAALLVPMAALVISDIVLAFTIHRGFPITTTKYYLFALTVLLGTTLHGRV